MMSEYLLFNVCSETWGLLLCATCIFCALMMNQESMLQRRSFLHLFITNSVVLAADVLALLSNGSEEANGYSMVMVSNTVLYMASFMLLTLFTDYICDQLAETLGREVKTKLFVRFFCYAMMVLVLVNMFIPIFFRVDEANFYIRYDLYWVALVAGIAVAVIDEIVVLRYHRELSPGQILYLSLYTVFPTIAMILQMRYAGLSLLNMTTTLLLMGCFIGMMSESNKLILRQRLALASKENELTESKAQMMLSQIQPHFLYNSLNSIYYLCGKDPKMAQKAVGDFADYLRMNLDSLKTREKIPFAMELKHIQTYLWLEHLRFDDRLNVVYDIQCRDFMLPVLVVQPLVENAVKHGICARSEGGTVTLSTREEDGDVIITVEDDGVGFDPGKKPEDGRTHIGLQNVEHRIKLEMNGTLSVDSEVGRGTRITIRFPKGDSDEYRSSR